MKTRIGSEINLMKKRIKKNQYNLKYMIFEYNKEKIRSNYENELLNLYKNNLTVLRREDRINMKKIERNKKTAKLVIGKTK